jgi:hypothetical protein
MYDYEIRRIKAAELEHTLEKLSESDWEVFAIVPAGEDIKAPLTGEQFLVVGRRPRSKKP